MPQWEMNNGVKGNIVFLSVNHRPFSFREALELQTIYRATTSNLTLSVVLAELAATFYSQEKIIMGPTCHPQDGEVTVWCSMLPLPACAAKQGGWHNSSSSSRCSHFSALPIPATPLPTDLCRCGLVLVATLASPAGAPPLVSPAYATRPPALCSCCNPHPLLTPRHRPSPRLVCTRQPHVPQGPLLCRATRTAG